MNASVKLIELVLPATVSLRAVVPEEHVSARILGTERFGSGVVVDSAGLILTANYVVMGAQTAEVTLLDNSTVEASVVAQDYASGIAPKPDATFRCASNAIVWVEHGQFQSERARVRGVKGTHA